MIEETAVRVEISAARFAIKMAKMLTEMWNGHHFCIAWTGKNSMGLWTA